MVLLQEVIIKLYDNHSIINYVPKNAILISNARIHSIQYLCGNFMDYLLLPTRIIIQKLPIGKKGCNR